MRIICSKEIGTIDGNGQLTSIVMNCFNCKKKIDQKGKSEKDKKGNPICLDCCYKIYEDNIKGRKLNEEKK